MENLTKISVKLAERSYDIFIGYNQFESLGKILQDINIGTHAVIITNPKIKKLYRGKIEQSLRKVFIKSNFVEIPDSEKSKSIDRLTKVILKIVEIDIKKRVFIIALGGGVVGDLAGFVASIYRRGIPYIQIPTTLLGQVDSSIGGKVAVDLPQGKNLIGAFYQPRLVFSDISTLLTLNARQMISGLAEVIKYGIIAKPNLFKFTEGNYHNILKFDIEALTHIVTESARIKASIVSEDEKEQKSKRTILNFGHTIGHALEAATEYGKDYTHGEAIAVGMICASDLAYNLKVCSQKTLSRIESIISMVGLPIHIKNASLTKIMKTYLHDKKFISCKNRFVLPVRIGNVTIYEDVPEHIIKKVIKRRIKN